VKNWGNLPDGEPMFVFGWLLRGNIPCERRNSEGIRRETERQDRGKRETGEGYFVNLHDKEKAMKYLRYFLFLVFSIWIFTRCTTNSPEPSISSVEMKMANDSIKKFDSLVTITKPHNKAKSFSYAKRALAFGIRTDNPEILAKAFILMGIVYTNIRNDSSYFYYTEATKIVEMRNLSPLKPSLFLNFSTLYEGSNDYKMTTVLLDSAIRMAYKEKDFVILSTAYNSLGRLKFNLHDSAGAKIMFDSSFHIAKKYQLFKQMGVSLGNLGLFEPNVIKSIQIQRQAIRLLEKATRTEKSKALILINIGSQCQDPDSSISSYNCAIQYADSIGSNEIKIAALNNLAYSYLDKKDFHQAELCLIGQAIPIAESENNFDWMSTLYDSYADILKSEGKVNEALKFEKEAFDFREKADIKQASDQIRLLTVLLDVKNKEIKIETYGKELRNKETRIQEMKLLFISILFLAGAFVFIILWIVQRKKLNLQKQLVVSARRIINAEENLKGRLAMELHDLISPLYTQIVKQIDLTKFHDATVKAELRTNLIQLTEKIRQISHKMNKVYIEQLTFVELVKGVCEDMQYLTDIPIKIEISKEPIDLTPETATHLFRIIQELLANAVKYVKFGVINLSVTIEFQNLYIFYKDDGPGFDPKSTTLEGIGLLNIIERARLIGGEAKLESAPGKDTHWTICIPNSSIN
jgi:signal transduction histidine kinase